MFEVQRSTKEGDVRVTTAFNRMLRLPRASVQDVAFGGEGVIVTVRLRRKRPVCSGCGTRGLPIKEHRLKSWRHLDLGACRCHVECLLRRLYCPGCGDVYEQVPWARAGSPVYARLRGHGRVPGAADGQDADHQADADRVAVGREDPRPRRCGQARRGRLDGLVQIGVRRGQLCLRASLPDLRRQPPDRRGGVGRAGPQRRDLAGVLR